MMIVKHLIMNMIMILRRKNSISMYLHSPRISAPPTQICQLGRANKSDNGRETVVYTFVKLPKHHFYGVM